MRSNWLLTGSAATAAFLAGFLAGCQTYDFEPVEPLSLGKEEVIADITARVVPPNLVLLFDKSDSMDRPEDPSDPDCQTGDEFEPVCGGGAFFCNESMCPTRLSRAREALGQFLAPEGGSYPFRTALAAFPIQGQCSPTSKTFVQLPTSEAGSDLAATASQVNAVIQNIAAESGDPAVFNFEDDETAGGTPTADSLRYIKDNMPALQDTAGGRRNFVLLLTDGLPNCNSNHPPYTTADDPSNPCRCAIDPVDKDPATPSRCVSAPQGCLDDNSTVSAINDLRAAGVQTIVVGLGAETAAGLGPETLERMGAAGGFARKCESNANCGEGDTCNPTSKTCGKSFYQASNGAALAAALLDIATGIVIENPCRVTFDSQPSDPSLVFVRVDGEQIPSNNGANWIFDDQGLLFQGQVCERIEASTPDAPVKVKVSVIQSQ